MIFFLICQNFYFFYFINDYILLEKYKFSVLTLYIENDFFACYYWDCQCRIIIFLCLCNECILELHIIEYECHLFTSDIGMTFNIGLYCCIHLIICILELLHNLLEITFILMKILCNAFYLLTYYNLFLLKKLNNLYVYIFQMLCITFSKFCV